LEIDVVQLFKAKNTEQDNLTINEPHLHKVKLLNELDDVQKNSFSNKRMKQALRNAMSI
jgi:hypothetical protein